MNGGFDGVRRMASWWKWLARVWLVAWFVLQAGAGVASVLPDELKEAISQAGIPQDAVGIVVEPLDGGEPVVSLNAESAFHTASTMKVVTTYAALELLGPSKVWKTGAYAAGVLENGVLNGDLYIRGSGDPSFSQAELWQFVRKIQDSGVREIRGDVILDRSVFGVRDYDVAAFDEAPLKPYNAGPNGLLLNEKKVNVRFVPDVARDTVMVFMEPRMERITIVPPVAGSSECGNWQSGMTVQFDDRVAYFEGEYPLSCGEKVWVIHPYQMSDLRYFESVFARLWRESGGVLSGRFAEGGVPADARLIAEWVSPELGVIVNAVNKYSNNVMARQLLLSLGEAVYGQGVTEKEGAQVIRGWLAEKGIATGELTIENGSGLSREEKIAPATMADILGTAYRSPVMPELMSSLPLVGRDGTMSKRLRDDEVAGKAHVKTGAIKDVRAIAGYVLAKSGRRYLVVCLVNHPEAGRAREMLNHLLRWTYANG